MSVGSCERCGDGILALRKSAGSDPVVRTGLAIGSGSWRSRGADRGRMDTNIEAVSCKRCCDIWGDLGIASWRWSGVSERENVITTLF